ncbi:MAG: hypothetical protein AAB588_04295 [Patescibacteria group bacterium]
MSLGRNFPDISSRFPGLNSVLGKPDRALRLGVGERSASFINGTTVQEAIFNYARKLRTTIRLDGPYWNHIPPVDSANNPPKDLLDFAKRKMNEHPEELPRELLDALGLQKKHTLESCQDPTQLAPGDICLITYTDGDFAKDMRHETAAEVVPMRVTSVPQNTGSSEAEPLVVGEHAGSCGGDPKEKPGVGWRPIYQIHRRTDGGRIFVIQRRWGGGHWNGLGSMLDNVHDPKLEKISARKNGEHQYAFLRVVRTTV